MRILRLVLPNAVAARLALAARRRNQSKSAVVRAILDKGLMEGEMAERSCLELAADLVGCVAGTRDLSTHKRHLCAYGR